jgi:hypothetical protein
MVAPATRRLVNGSGSLTSTGRRASPEAREEHSMRGHCLCGAVSFEADVEKRESHACHCEMCRRWSGSAMLAVSVPEAALRIEGAERIRTYRSSDWAERAWCDACGSNLWYRITADGPYLGGHEICLGLFDTPDDLPLAKEIYIDRKTSSFAFAGERATMTQAEVEAMFAPPEAGVGR